MSPHQPPTITSTVNDKTVTSLNTPAPLSTPVTQPLSALCHLSSLNALIHGITSKTKISQTVGNHRKPRTLLLFWPSYKNHAKKPFPTRSQLESSSTDRVADWLMSTSQRNTSQEGRRKRKRTSFAGEKSLQPASVIAKSAGNKGTHSYGQILYLLGLRTETIFVDVPEVDGPQPTFRLRPWSDSNGVEPGTSWGTNCWEIFS